MLNLPVAEDSMPDGSSKEQPFRLEGIDIDDFKQLCKILCPMSAMTSTGNKWLTGSP